MKVVFKLSRAPTPAGPPSGNTPAVGAGPLPITPQPNFPPASSPGLVVPKPGRLVIKPMVSTTPGPYVADDALTPRPSPRPNSEPDDDARLKGKRDARGEPEGAPVAKKWKELEVDDDVVVDIGAGIMAGERAVTPVQKSKKWVPMRKALNNALKKLIDLDSYKLFYEPVSEKDAPGYHSIIKQPMDFVTMRKKLTEDKYPYWNLFTADFELICQNCITFNPPNSIYFDEAKTLLLEGRKYLKGQSMKINPALLEAPADIGAASTSSASSTSASSATMTRTHLIPILELPKRLYLRNEDLPRHLLAPPPPVQILQAPNSKAPIFPQTNDLVALHTPQQQVLVKPGSFPLYTINPEPTATHWGKLVPNYIQHTRGHVFMDIDAPVAEHEVGIAQGEGDFKDFVIPDSLYHSRALSQHRLYLISLINRTKRAQVGSQSLKGAVDALEPDQKERLAQISDLLLRAPSHTLRPDSFTRLNGIPQLSEVDTSALASVKDPLKVAGDLNVNAELKNLRATLASAHLDLSFLDTLFQVDANQELPPQALSSALMLENNTALLEQLNASLQARRPGISPTETEHNQLTEVSANLMSLTSLVRPSSLLSSSTLESIHSAVQLDLPSIPNTTHVPRHGAVKSEKIAS